MKVTELSNYFNILVQMHKQQAFAYPSLQYYKAGQQGETEVNRQNNFDPQGSKGTQYPFLLMPYPDAQFDYIKQGSKVTYNIDLYFNDLQFYANNGTNDNRSTIEIQRDLVSIATDIIEGLNAIARLNGFQVTQGQPSSFEFLEHQNKDRVCILRINLQVVTNLPCSTFIFNPASLPAGTPYPVTDSDYEKIVT